MSRLLSRIPFVARRRERDAAEDRRLMGFLEDMRRAEAEQEADPAVQAVLYRYALKRGHRAA